MFDLPDTPVTTLITVSAAGVLTVTAYFVKKSSEDRKHLVDTYLEMKKVDSEQQASMLNIMKEMTDSKSLS